jgi:TRAP-type uncharacterized transport system substrate-binding protein
MNSAIVKGDLFGSLKGRLSVADRNLHDLAMVRSLGRLFYEPIWVFTREKLPPESLRNLKKRRIVVGSKQSATRRNSHAVVESQWHRWKEREINGDNAVI